MGSKALHPPSEVHVKTAGTILAVIVGLLQSPGLVSASVIATSTCLPPSNGGYVGDTNRYHNGWPVGSGRIEFGNPQHNNFSTCTPAPPPIPGASSIHVFSSSLSGILTFDGLNPVGISAPGDMTVLVAFAGMVGNVQTFDTEMLQFDVSGGNLPPGVMLRQSPTNPSLGQTTIEDLGGGLFKIDSFFDVWTDLSLDGGNSWIPSEFSGRVNLVPIPEPATAGMLAAALLIAAGARRSRIRFPGRR
jgi:hypothetical protein